VNALAAGQPAAVTASTYKPIHETATAAAICVMGVLPETVSAILVRFNLVA
jgi:hypothetical protein